MAESTMSIQESRKLREHQEDTPTRALSCQEGEYWHREFGSGRRAMSVQKGNEKPSGHQEVKRIRVARAAPIDREGTELFGGR